jgi:hypothetical protein
MAASARKRHVSRRIHPRLRVLAAAGCAVCACLAGGPAFSDDTPAAGEYEVKAAFLFNFLRYIEWPDEKDPKAAGAPLAIGILGENPFGEAIDKLSTRSVRGRPVEIRHCRSAEEAGQCALLFVAGSEAPRLDAILKSLAGHPVLTIGDTPGFAEAGGAVELYLEGTQVRFKVNLDAAERSRLKISSKLLRLATVVRSR